MSGVSTPEHLVDRLWWRQVSEWETYGACMDAWSDWVKVLVGVALPRINIGNRRVVVAKCPEYRMSAAFFVYEVRWNALIWAAMLCSRTVDRFGVSRRRLQREPKGELSRGDERGFQE
jgi:hypothetical protein